MSPSRTTHPVSRADLAPMLAHTRDWLLGTVHDTPHHYGPPCPETQPLLPVLLRANSRGILTTGSQPGLRRGPWRQRAFLDAITTSTDAEHLVEHLTRAGLYADHWPLARPPGGRGPITVTVGPHGAHTRFLQPAGTIDANPYGEPATLVVFDDTATADFHEAMSLAWPEHQATLSRCHAVLAMDPTWGPSALLWTALDAALDGLDVIDRPRGVERREGHRW